MTSWSSLQRKSATFTPSPDNGTPRITSPMHSCWTSSRASTRDHSPFPSRVCLPLLSRSCSNPQNRIQRKSQPSLLIPLFPRWHKRFLKGQQPRNGLERKENPMGSLTKSSARRALRHLKRGVFPPHEIEQFTTGRDTESSAV